MCVLMISLKLQAYVLVCGGTLDVQACQELTLLLS
jgi:hypothetical protein